MESKEALQKLLDAMDEGAPESQSDVETVFTSEKTDRVETLRHVLEDIRWLKRRLRTILEKWDEEDSR